MNARIWLVIGSLCVFSGCDNDDTKQAVPLSVKERFDERYTPPVDGRLTKQQVNMYIEVKDKAKKSERTVDDAEFASFDLQIAEEAGYNPAEFSWVKNTLLDVAMHEWELKAINEGLKSQQKAIDQAATHIDGTGKDNSNQIVLLEQLQSLMLQSEQNQKRLLKREQEPAFSSNLKLLKEFSDKIDFANVRTEKSSALSSKAEP